MSEDITLLLNRWSDGDERAMEELTPLVYAELKQLSMRIFRSENPGHTLQPTALVSELYEKLVDTDIRWSDRNHFFALSARIMRRILVSHARVKGAAKRGGEAIAVTLNDEMIDSAGDMDIEIMSLDRAIGELAEMDPRRAEMIELHYFGGLTYAELADVLKVSEATVYRDLRVANAWLRSRI